MARLSFGRAISIFAVGVTIALSLGDAGAQKRGGTAHVYVMSGLAGFTSRLDGVIAKIQSRGVPLTRSHPTSWSSLAASAIEGYKSGRIRSVIIVGYSAGGGATMGMARQLQQANVPVELIVTVEPMGFTGIPSNVRRVLNYYVPGGVSGAMPRPMDFRGVLTNIEVKNPNLGHWTLARAKEDEVVRAVLAAAGRGGGVRSSPTPKTTARAKPVASRAQGGREQR